MAERKGLRIITFQNHFVTIDQDGVKTTTNIITGEGLENKPAKESTHAPRNPICQIVPTRAGVAVTGYVSGITPSSEEQQSSPPAEDAY